MRKEKKRKEKNYSLLQQIKTNEIRNENNLNHCVPLKVIFVLLEVCVAEI
jgi:hypothetical protein